MGTLGDSVSPRGDSHGPVHERRTLRRARLRVGGETTAQATELAEQRRVELRVFGYRLALTLPLLSLLHLLLRLAAQLAARLKVPTVLAQILLNRGICDPAECESTVLVFGKVDS